MKYCGLNRVEELKIAYIGGGSHGWAWGLMSDLASEPALSGSVALYDIDFAAAQNNAVIGNRFSALPECVGRWHYSAVENLQDALKGADFVIISILPGTFDEMQSDVHSGERYGIYHSVGDTVGPGGLVRSLRAVPMFRTIAEAIRDWCPQAWVINYTNPMSVLTRTLYEVFPEIHAFGCCHEVFDTEMILCEMLEELQGIKGIGREDLDVNVIGINHFTWLAAASYKGIDLYPLYREFVDKYYEKGYDKEKHANWLNHFFVSKHRVKFDLFRKYGLIAAAGDRHLAEFMRRSTGYMTSPAAATGWGFELTPVAWRKENQKKLREKARMLASGEMPVQIDKTGEEGVRQMKALLGLADLITNVNLPNRGQIENIPHGTVVETNAWFTANGIAPIMSGSVPENILELMEPHVQNQKRIVKAALECDYDLALCAFRHDPLVELDDADSEQLFKTMLENTRKYLPEQWFI